jgi:hypothetical protein
MQTSLPQTVLSELVEKLAGIEHERWSHWQRYLHSKCRRQPDGSLVIPADLVSKWERESATPYAELPESERESDRVQVGRYLPFIMEVLGVTVDPVPLS